MHVLFISGLYCRCGRPRTKRRVMGAREVRSVLQSQVYTLTFSTFRHPTATESPAFTSSVAQLASAFDC
jgi:hypothetical protein